MEAIIHQLKAAIKSIETNKTYDNFDVIIRVDGISVSNISHIDDIYSLFGIDSEGNNVIMFCQSFIPTLVIRPKAEEHRKVCGFNKECKI